MSAQAQARRHVLASVCHRNGSAGGVRRARIDVPRWNARGVLHVRLIRCRTTPYCPKLGTESSESSQVEASSARQPSWLQRQGLAGIDPLPPARLVTGRWRWRDWRGSGPFIMYIRALAPTRAMHPVLVVSHCAGSPGRHGRVGGRRRLDGRGDGQGAIVECRVVAIIRFGSGTYSSRECNQLEIITLNVERTLQPGGGRQFRGYERYEQDRSASQETHVHLERCGRADCQNGYRMGAWKLGQEGRSAFQRFYSRRAYPVYLPQEQSSRLFRLRTRMRYGSVLFWA
jgi:hypothetical protein